MRTLATTRSLVVLLLSLALGAGAGLGCASSSGPRSEPVSPRASADRVRPPAPSEQPGVGGRSVTPPRRAPAGVLDPDRARTHYRLGSDHLRNGRAALAIRELLTAEGYDPFDEWIQLTLAEAYIHRGHLEDAEARLARALEIEPGFHEAMLHLSALYIHLERYAEVVPLASALVNDPTYPQPWKALVNLGFAEFKLGRIDAAREHLELASAYHDRYWQPLLNLGILEQEAGRKLEALQYFERVVELRPGALAEAEAHYRMALVYISLGNRERALEHFGTAASKKPSGPWGKQSEEYLSRLR